MKKSGSDGSSGFQSQLEVYLRDNDLKITGARRAIVDAMLTFKDHFSIEQLVKVLERRKKKPGLATIYRTIHLLTQARLLDQKRFNDSTIPVFEILDPNEHHDHLICVECGKVVEFHSEVIEREQEKIADHLGFQLRSHRHDLYAVCLDRSQCRPKTYSPHSSS